ncbi:MAG: hypothetical protein KatS3mg115_1968 [Candidatus Poribacteria bacterium]|nr:MAG: hypothetical protein KatS3mg115_1968 [Candidatus Poribacteria bacterium]
MDPHRRSAVLVVGALIALGALGLWVLLRRPPGPWTARDRLGAQLAQLIERYARTPYGARFSPLDEAAQSAIDRLLTEALDRPGNDFAARMNRLRGLLQGASIADAREGRAMDRARIKLGLAEALALGDLQSAITRCGFRRLFESPVLTWRPEDRPEGISSSFGEVDDLLALDQVLPFLVSGVGYRASGGRDAAIRAFQAVLQHRQAGIEQFGEGFLEVAGAEYREAIRIAEEELDNSKEREGRP